MRTDLRAAMKEGRREEARLIRGLIAALDNAEAPPLPIDPRGMGQRRFNDGTAEVGRLCLGREQVNAILAAEIREREHAAAEMDRHGQLDRGDALRIEAAIARRYID